MDTQKFDSLIRNAITGQEKHYDSLAEEARGRIWGKIQQTQKRRPSVLVFTLAAACALLLLVSSILFYSLRRSQDMASIQAQTISLLKSKTGLQSATAVNKALASAEKKTDRKDTVYIVLERIVTAEAASTSPDTVYIQQIVYVNKPAPVSSAENLRETPEIDSTKAASPVKNTEILISSGSEKPKAKSRKLRIRFGGEHLPENNGNLALTARY